MPNSNIRINSITEKDTSQSVEVSKLAPIGVADGAVIYVDTVADLQALDTSGLASGQQASVGEAGMFVWSGSEWLPKNSETITVRIPSDYPTLQEALDDLSNFMPTQGAFITLLIESGHDLTQGLKVINGDYSHFIISSEDSVVFLDSGFSTVSATEVLSGYTDVLFASVNAKAPVWDILIDCDGYTGDPLIGYLLGKQSSGVVNAGKGVIRAYRNGECRNGTLAARNSVWTDSVGIGADGIYHGFRATSASVVDIAGADVSRAASRGLDVTRGSVAYSNNIIANDCGSLGIEFRRSFGSIENATVTNSGDVGVQIGSGSNLQAGSMTIENSGSNGLVVLSGSRCAAQNSTIIGSQFRNVWIRDGSSVNLNGATIENSGTTNIELQAAYASCAQATVTGSGGTNSGIISRRGSHVSAWLAHVADNGGNDFTVQTGGIIAANSATGDLTFSQTINTITENGIIFADS